ncbi:D(4) dopamine receptor-like [Lissotriton helveticus]
MVNVTFNQTLTGAGPGSPDRNYLALIFGIPLILIIILGNTLVCLSVLTERTLKTATNYYIVSLAVADLLLALLVLPLYVYSEFLGGIWTLNMSVCDALMTMDVMLCTASILNLCAISVDRFIAVVIPLKYNRNHFSIRQMVLIAATWILSLGVASPVIFGLNRVPNRNPDVCKLEDNNFVVYSSVCSFFVPCPIMLLLYYWMFRGLRKWSASRKAQLARFERRFSLRLKRDKKEKVKFLMPSLSPESGEKGPPENDLMAAQMDSTSDIEAPEKTKEGNHQENGLNHKRRSFSGSHSKSRRVSGRERKAMKVLPVVVGVFLACWTPFFVVHVTKVLCTLSCNIGPKLISVVTWLGYVNSAVNPIIYTAFNTEFRKVFQKLLCCQT